MVTFANGQVELVGSLYKPLGDSPRPAIVAIHPATGGERTDPFYSHLKSVLPRCGIASLIFDRRGCGASGGRSETANFTDLADDVIAAVEYLQTRPDIDKTRIGVHGTSQGAWIAPIAAVRKPDIRLIVAVSASGVSPADQMDFGVSFHLRADGYDQAIIDQALRLRRLVNEYYRGRIRRADVAEELRRFESESWLKAAYLPTSTRLPVDVTLSKWYYEMDYEPLPIWTEVTQPTLFLFAGVDGWVPLDQSMVNYRSASSHLEDVTLRQIPGTDHLMRDRDGVQSREYVDTLTEWLTSRLRN
jgi:pimeloyl-ACP methyl ester carboxylesterase